MWLTSSSVGRKFVMALTGACLVLFVTFHCLMNSVAIFWPTAYNAVCEFLGANWYALIASAGLALLIVIHIIYACWLTVMNRKARGNVRYSVEVRPKSVEWSSKNMLVLGIVVLAFLCVHMCQFWAKMQLVEVRGCEGEFPAAAGTLFLHQAFSCWFTPVCYAIGFIALWFHLNHGFWSMFQSVGWDNTTWIPRLKCIGKIWVGIVMVLFFVQIAVFTFRANTNYYLKNEGLREQYQEMIINDIKKSTDKQTAQLLANMSNAASMDQLAEADFEYVGNQIRIASANIEPTYQALSKHSAEIKQLAQKYPNNQLATRLNSFLIMGEQLLPSLKTASATYEFIEPASAEVKTQMANVPNQKEMEEDIAQMIIEIKAQGDQPAYGQMGY